MVQGGGHRGYGYAGLARHGGEKEGLRGAVMCDLICLQLVRV